MNQELDSVTAQVAYVNEAWRHRSTLPEIYSRQTRQDNTSLRKVSIYDARPLHNNQSLDLDLQGFVLVDQPTTFSMYRDKTQVLAQYLPEMADLLQQVTGAVEVLPFPFYQVRTANPEHFFDAYSLYMHCDYSLSSCKRFAQSIIKRHDQKLSFPNEDYDFAFFNMWRAVGDTVQRDPLAWIDASTLDVDDVIDYRPAKENTASGVAAVPLFNKNQRHYYFPQMAPNEVLILKQLDSRQGLAQVCPHTSFADSRSPADAPARQSIDVRFLCIFPKNAD